MFKFKKNQIVYLIVKHTFKPNEYIKCKIIMCTMSLEWYKYSEPWNDTHKYHKYSIETNNAETSKYSTNNKNIYLEYEEKQLISLNEYRSLKLKKLSGEKYLKFFPKKIFHF